MARRAAFRRDGGRIADPTGIRFAGRTGGRVPARNRARRSSRISMIRSSS
jgi:hypothetical protein